MSSTTQIKQLEHVEVDVISQQFYTKAGCEQFAEAMIQKIEAGEIDPLKLAVGLASMGTVIGMIKDKLTEYVLEALMDHPGGKTSLHGVKIEKAEAGTKYDYSHDTAWKALSEKLEPIKAEMKIREELLKAIPAGKALVDEETGEALVGPAKTSTTTYKITLPK